MLGNTIDNPIVTPGEKFSGNGASILVFYHDRGYGFVGVEVADLVFRDVAKVWDFVGDSVDVTMLLFMI